MLLNSESGSQRVQPSLSRANMCGPRRSASDNHSYLGNACAHPVRYFCSTARVIVKVAPHLKPDTAARRAESLVQLECGSFAIGWNTASQTDRMTNGLINTSTDCLGNDFESSNSTHPSKSHQEIDQPVLASPIPLHVAHCYFE